MHAHACDHIKDMHACYSTHTVPTCVGSFLQRHASRSSSQQSSRWRLPSKPPITYMRPRTMAAAWLRLWGGQKSPGPSRVHWAQRGGDEGASTSVRQNVQHCDCPAARKRENQLQTCQICPGFALPTLPNGDKAQAKVQRLDFEYQHMDLLLVSGIQQQAQPLKPPKIMLSI